MAQEQHIRSTGRIRSRRKIILPLTPVIAVAALAAGTSVITGAPDLKIV